MFGSGDQVAHCRPLDPASLSLCSVFRKRWLARVRRGGGWLGRAVRGTAAARIAIARLGCDGGPSAAEIDAAKRSFRVFAQRKEDASEPDGYVVPHTAFTYLLGPSGTYVTHFPDHVPAEQVIERLRAAIGDG